MICRWKYCYNFIPIPGVTRVHLFLKNNYINEYESQIKMISIPLHHTQPEGNYPSNCIINYFKMWNYRDYVIMICLSWTQVSKWCIKIILNSNKNEKLKASSKWHITGSVFVSFQFGFLRFTQIYVNSILILLLCKNNAYFYVHLVCEYLCNTITILLLPFDLKIL